MRWSDAYVAQALGISIDTLDDYPFDLDENASDDGLIYGWRVLWNEDSRPVSMQTARRGCYGPTFLPRRMNPTRMIAMRKVRDYDAELKAAKALKAKRVEQLGALVMATGADTLDTETLAGLLLDAAASKDADMEEAWRVKGAAFFQRRGRKGSRKAGGDGGTSQSGADPASGSGAASH